MDEEVKNTNKANEIQKVVEGVRDYLDDLLLENITMLEEDITQEILEVLNPSAEPSEHEYEVKDEHQFWLVRINPKSSDLPGYLSSVGFSEFNKIQKRVSLLLNTTFGERNAYMTIHPYFIKPGIWNLGAVCLLHGKPKRIELLQNHPQFNGEGRIKFIPLDNFLLGTILCQLQFITDDTSEDIRTVLAERGIVDGIQDLDNERLYWLSNFGINDLSWGSLERTLRKAGVL